MDVGGLDSLGCRGGIGLVFGLLLGSFTTMLSYRIPRKLSIVCPGSYCPLCGVPLRVRDLVPLVSWLVQRGRCRHCGAPMSPRYVIIESVTTLAVTSAFVVIGFRPALIPAVVGVVALVTWITINLEKKG